MTSVCILCWKSNQTILHALLPELQLVINFLPLVFTWFVNEELEVLARAPLGLHLRT